VDRCGDPAPIEAERRRVAQAEVVMASVSTEPIASLMASRS
jgi:hypothetical protein